MSRCLRAPSGHGPGSYGHVSHAYQTVPMLWSGSPHSVWALAAVETGVPGLLALIALAGVAFISAMRRRSALAAALVAGSVVMSLDVFSSMPIQSLLWWGVIGAAYGPPSRVRPEVGVPLFLVFVAVVVAAIVASARLSLPCDENCEPIERYGGHPEYLSPPVLAVDASLADARWSLWKEKYPLAFWLASAHASSRAPTNPGAMLEVLRDYPFQSAQRFIDVSDSVSDASLARDIASCGLARFFDGRRIYRDWRSSGAELTNQERALALRGGTDEGEEAACARAGIPSVPVGVR